MITSKVVKQLKKMGGSSVLIIPSMYLKIFGMSENDKVEISLDLENEQIVLKKTNK
jgi:antitoxin component of MazEF toxin-antitoxin module